MSTKLVCGLALLASAEAFSPAAPNAAAAVRMPAVSMNTKYTVGRDTIGFKKNKKTGSSANLKGYTVGSRAPAASRSRCVPQRGGRCAAGTHRIARSNPPRGYARCATTPPPLCYEKRAVDTAPLFFSLRLLPSLTPYVLVFSVMFFHVFAVAPASTRPRVAATPPTAASSRIRRRSAARTALPALALSLPSSPSSRSLVPSRFEPY